MAVSPFAIWYSQETRYVNLFMLAAALSTLFAQRWFESGRFRDLALYVVATLLTLFSFVAGIFLLAAQNIWMALAARRARRLRRWAAAQMLIAILFVPWLMRTYHIDLVPAIHSPATELPLGRVSVGYYSRPTEPVQIAYVLHAFGVGYSLGPSTRALHEDLSLGAVKRKATEVAAALLIMGTLGVSGLVRARRMPNARGLLLLVSVLCPVHGPYAVALVSDVAYNVRYTAAAFPAFVVILGAGLWTWLERSRPVGIALAAALTTVTAVSLVQYYGDPEYARDDNRGAAELLTELRHASEPLVVGSSVEAFRFYYRRPFYHWTDVELVASEDPNQSEVATPRRIWVAVTRPWQAPELKRLVAQLESCLHQERRFILAGYVVASYRSPSGNDAPACMLRKRTVARSTAPGQSHSAAGAEPEGLRPPARTPRCCANSQHGARGPDESLSREMSGTRNGSGPEGRWG
jgi:hypothetical protein